MMGRPLIVLCLMPALAGSAFAQDTGTPGAVEIEATIRSGRYVEAEEQARVYLQAVQASTGRESLAAAAATDLYLRALILNGKGALPSTTELAEANAIQKERIVGHDEPDLAPSLLSWGQALSLSAKHPEAIAVLERAVRLVDRPGASAPILAPALDELGRALNRAEQYDRALPVLRRSLAVKERADVSGRSLALTIQSLGAVLQSKSEYREARPLIERALALHRQEGANHPEAIDSWTQLGQQFFFEGRLTEARDAYKEAVDTAERTLRPDHPALAYTLKDLGVALLELGDLRTAQLLNERALAIVEGSLGPQSAETARYLNTLANLCQLLGDYPKARALYDRGLRISRARLGERNDWVATFMFNLALLDARLGDFAQARREHARAVAIWESVYDRFHPFVALALTSMAGVLREEGRPAEAAPMLERALAIRLRRLGPNHRDVARTLGDLALTVDQLGQSTRALTLSQQALAIFEQMSGAPTPDHKLLMLRGALLARRGDFEGARAVYARARDIRAELYGPVHPLVAEAAAGIATADAGLGRASEAFAAAATAERVGRDHLQLMLRSLPERQSLNYAATRPKGLDVMLSVADQSPSATSDVADAIIRSRAVVFDEMATRRRLVHDESASLAAIEDALSGARQRLANLVVRGAGQQPTAQYRALVDSTRQEAEDAERALAEQSASFRAERSRTLAGLSDVLSRVPSDAAVISFRRFGRLVFPKATVPPSRRAAVASVQTYIGLILRAGRDPVAVPLGSASEIDRLVGEWRQAIAAEALSGAITSSRVTGQALRRRIWDPFAARIAGVSRVFIVPDGAINVVPFVALPIGTRSYLLETGPTIHYLTAERDVYDLVDSSSSVGRGLLAVGGPAFGSVRPSRSAVESQRPSEQPGAGTGCAGFRNARFEPLTGSLDEVRQITNLWSRSPHATEPLRVLTGLAANEEAFKRDAPGYRVLHLATHGFFLTDECSEAIPSSRAVGGLARATARPSNPTSRAPNPLALSALALAGANRRAAAAINAADGILTAEEVASMRLTGVEWAVLSACDTGLGVLISGEGVMGLRRAFQVAGARTVIMSLWSVDDRATQELMHELYDIRLVRGLTSDEALRRASLSVLEQRRAAGKSTVPFYWASFVAAGDWR